MADVLVGYPVMDKQIDEYVKQRNGGSTPNATARSVLGYHPTKSLTHLEWDTVTKLIQLGTDRAVIKAVETAVAESENVEDADAQPEMVDHPKHYNMYKGVEVIDLVEQMKFNPGNAVKYLTRAPFKGNEIQDMEKAIWYIQREIERLTAE